MVSTEQPSHELLPVPVPYFCVCKFVSDNEVEGINGRLTSDTTFAEPQPFQLFSQQLRLMRPAGLLYQMWIRNL
jgi:hypothetical protein